MLRQSHFECSMVLWDIYNMKAKAKNTFLAGRSLLEALLDMLIESISRTKSNEALRANSRIFSLCHFLRLSLPRIIPRMIFFCLIQHKKQQVPDAATSYTKILQDESIILLGVLFHGGGDGCGLSMSHVGTERCYWAFDRSKDLVIVNDRELALMNVIREIYSIAYNLLCI